MDIWVLVTILLVISIILLVISFFMNEDSDVQERIEELTVQQSQELYQLKTRLAELEARDRSDYSGQTNYSPVGVVEPVEDSIDPSLTMDDLTDEQHEDIIRFYSQGYTMHEISQQVKVPSKLVQDVVDDYIENR
ncbi:hypothetical protein [Vaginisenegalia massiliensis]|uniref:hypothetical protein n=1 Tax=Vaginisenegalia massiliensis TaxID=2058294 RepID=UPI000F536A54|nr:hypothetical protein [Vaginisenegalia massiliensis]